MNDMAAFAQEFYKANPTLINEGVEAAISLIEKALKAEQKGARERLAAAEAIKAHGAGYLHAVFDEALMNEIPTAALFPQYHLQAAFGEAMKGKGKSPVMPSREQKAEAEKQLREVVFDGEVFALVPGKGARQESVVRLLKADGSATGATVAVHQPLSGGTADVAKLVEFLGHNPGSNANAIKAHLNIDKAAWSKLQQAAKSLGVVKQKGEKLGAKYFKS